MSKKWNIGWGLTSRCNMACAFCYSKERRQHYQDVSLKECIKFVDENADSISTINYGTGENSLADDWFYFISYVRKHYPKIRQALTTNGFISEAVKTNPSNLDAFISAIDEVDVSLDFATAELHNRFRGQPQAYEWALNALKLCHVYDKSLTIVTLGSKPTLVQENMRGIFSIANYYDAVVRINIFRPTHGLDEIANEFILPVEQLLSFIEMAWSEYDVLAIDDPSLSALLTGRTVNDPSGRLSLRILPNGDVTPSTYLISNDFVLGNIKQNISLDSIDDNLILQGKMKNILPISCRNCKFSDTCQGGCLDRRYLWYNSLQEKDPYCFVDNPDLMREYEGKIALSSQPFISVHDGYLPTMFFKNRREA